MALVLKDTPIGLDRRIDQVQKWVYNKLNWTNYESYHRVYKNPTNDGDYPELFLDGIDYQEVFYDDRFTATSFFMVDDDKRFDEIYQVDVSLVYQVNLEELYPNILHRADEEVHRDVHTALNSLKSVDITGITTGIPRVYQSLGLRQVKLDDMQPKHVFKIDFTTTYEYNCLTDFNNG